MSVTSVAPIAGVARIAAPSANASAAARPRVKGWFMLLEALPDSERGVRALASLRELETDRATPELRDVESETGADVAVERVLVEVEGGRRHPRRVGRNRLAAADAGPAALGEPDHRELAVLRQRDAQLHLPQQDVGSVERVGIPAQVLVGEDEQLVGRDRARRDPGAAVQPQRRVLGHREELRAVDRDELVGEVGAERMAAELVVDAQV